MIKIEFDERKEIIRKIYMFDEDDYKNGPFKNYHENGLIWERGTYKRGKLNGLYELYYSNGQLGRRCSYNNGIRNGIYERYFSNGCLEIKCHYVDGQKEGEYETYYPNGRLHEKGFYEKGRLEGSHETYDKKGTIEDSGIMRRGKYVKHFRSEIEKRKKILRKELHEVNAKLPPNAVRQKVKRELVTHFRSKYPKSPLLHKFSQELSR